MPASPPEAKESSPPPGTARSFTLYLLAGLGSLATDLAVFGTLHHGLGCTEVVSHLVSRPAGGLACFFLNSKITFAHRDASDRRVEFLRFWVVFAASYALSTGLLWLIVDALHWTGILAKLVCEALILIFNYVCLRFWTFR